MADRRMIHRKVVESDSFYKLSEGAQSIYFHLTINADQDGFINGAQSIVARFKGGEKKLGELVSNRFVLKFGEIYVIKHWRIGNSLKNDRAKPPTYPGIAAAIWVKPNRAYTDHPVDGCQTLLEMKTGIQSESRWNPVGIQSESNWIPNKKGNEKKGNEMNRSADVGFGRIWDRYPEEHRGSMTAAWEAFQNNIGSEADTDTALENLELWKRSEQWDKDGGQFIPYLSNWLERGLWKTKPARMVSNGPRELDEDEIRAIRRMMAEPV